MKNLTVKGKRIVFISAAIALLIILAVAYQLIVVSQSETASGNPTALIFIAVLAVLASAAAFLRYFVRSGHTKKLDAAYYDKYERITLALQNTTLGYFERKDVAADILGILISGQESGKAPDEIIADPLEYVAALTDSFGKRSRFIFALISGFQMTIYSLAIVQTAVFFMRDGLTSFYQASIGISLIVYILILSFVLIPLVKSAALRKKILMSGLIIALIVTAYFAAHELADKFGSTVAWIQYYLNGEVVFIPSFVTALIWTAVFLATIALRYLLRKRSIQTL